MWNATYFELRWRQIAYQSFFFLSLQGHKDDKDTHILNQPRKKIRDWCMLSIWSQLSEPNWFAILCTWNKHDAQSNTPANTYQIHTHKYIITCKHHLIQSMLTFHYDMWSDTFSLLYLKKKNIRWQLYKISFSTCNGNKSKLYGMLIMYIS